MRLITMEFELHEEDLNSLRTDIDSLKQYWMDHAVRFQLFRDASRKMRFLCALTTDKSVDDFVHLIQADPQAKKLFDRLKTAGVHLVLSVLEEVS